MTEDEKLSKKSQKCLLGLISILSKLLDDYRKKPEPECVHQIRVHTRRIYSALICCQSMFPSVMIKKSRKDLQWIRRTFGEIREYDVAQQKIRKLFPQTTIIEQKALEYLEKSFAVSAENARKKINYLVYRKAKTIAARIQKTVNSIDPLLWPLSVSLEIDKGITYFLKRAEKRFKKIKSAEGFKEIHRFRLAIKQVRYAYDFKESVTGKTLKKESDKNKRYQDQLGYFNDYIFMYNHINDIRTGFSPVGDDTSDKMLLFKGIEIMENKLIKKIDDRKLKVEKLLSKWKI